VSRIIAALVTASLIFGIGFFVGKPMYDTYQQTGKLHIPGIGDYDISGISKTINDATGSSAPSGKIDAPAAVKMLNTLAVKGKAPMTGYSRELFPHWIKTKVDGVTCDTRNRVLRRDLTNVKLDSDKCTVLSGTLSDPYTGKTINFQRGPKSGAVQIDHLVPLANAWVTGAQSWDTAKRQQFANDMNLNLLAVDGPSNGAKGASDASGWLPPNKSVRCSYAAGMVKVKSTYGLWVTSAEKSALSDILSRC
jgi:hypothetical protein